MMVEYPLTEFHPQYQQWPPQAGISDLDNIWATCVSIQFYMAEIQRRSDDYWSRLDEMQRRSDEQI